MLEERPYRHGKLRRRLGTISQRMLTRTLRNLESSGLISRKITRSPKGGRMKSPTALAADHQWFTRAWPLPGMDVFPRLLTQLSSSMTPALWQEVKLPPNPAWPIPNSRETKSSA